jgi:PST family polysaccharide transporter
MSLKGELKSGVIINFITTYSSIGIKLVIWGVLARLLTPEEFGVVAVVAVFTGFFELISSMGLGPAVIQNRDLTDEDNSSIFIFVLLVGIILAFVFYNFSYFIAKFYQNEEYIKIGKYLSVSVFFHSISSLPVALIKKRGEFKKIGAIGVSSDLLIGILTVYLAYRGVGYFALVWKAVSSSVYVFILSFIYSDLKFKLSLNINSMKKIAGVSVYQFFHSFLGYFSRNTDNILIGKYIGIVPLGYYDKAYKLMLYSIQNLTHVINPVLLPIFSNYQEDSELVYRSYLKIIKLLAIIGMSLSIFLFFTANEIISILFGNQWASTVPLFKILALTVWMQIVLSSSSSVFQYKGRTDLLFLNGIISSSIMICCILYGVMNKSLILVAFGLLVSFIFSFIFCHWLMFEKIFNKELSSFFQVLKNPFKIAISIFIPLIFFSNYFLLENIYISFIIKIMSAGTGFFIGMFITREHYFIYNVAFKK